MVISILTMTKEVFTKAQIVAFCPGTTVSGGNLSNQKVTRVFEKITFYPFVIII